MNELNNRDEVGEILEAYKNYVVESITLKPTSVEHRKINLKQATQAINQLILEQVRLGRIDELNKLIAWAEANELELEARNLLDPKAAPILLEATVLPERIEMLVQLKDTTLLEGEKK